jgi:hypothetical protein
MIRCNRNPYYLFEGRAPASLVSNLLRRWCVRGWFLWHRQLPDGLTVIVPNSLMVWVEIEKGRALSGACLGFLLGIVLSYIWLLRRPTVRCPFNMHIKAFFKTLKDSTQSPLK